MSSRKSDAGSLGVKVPLFKQGELTVQVGDCVLLRPSEPSALPYIGKVKDIRKRKDDAIWFQVSWYYRPEETYCGRRLFHGQQEVFESNHVDWQHRMTVLCKCHVWNIAEYQDLATVTDTDFFTRLSYKPESKQFEPDIIPVYCVCELPYNPDQFMAQCEKCMDWFHPECLGMSAEDCEALRQRSANQEAGPAFYCSTCSESTGAGAPPRLAPVAPPLPNANRQPNKRPRLQGNSRT